MASLLLVVLLVVLVVTETALIYCLVRITLLCIPEKKYVIRGNVHSGKCHLGNCPSGKCLFWELSVRGTVLCATIRRGTVRWGNVFGKLSVSENSFRKKYVE